MIHLLTDGTSGLPYALAAKLGVRIVPITYTIGDRQYAQGYLDAGSDVEQLISQSEQRCYTAHPPVSLFADFFRNLSKNGDEVLCAVISSRLSGTFSSASIAAQDALPGRVAVVDSLTTAGGLALLVEEAAGLVAGGLSLNDCKAALEKKREETGLVFSVNDMSSLRRSGRLGLVRQSIGNMLNVRPILTCEEGIIKAQGISRGSAQTLKALAAQLPDNARRLIIHCQGRENDPLPLMSLLRRRFEHSDISVREVGPALRIHLGSGFIGIAWIA